MPWTKDPILAKYRFCNIRRKDDRVSQWILSRVIKPNAKATHLGPWLALCRFVNWPPTIQMLMDNGYGPDKHSDWTAIGRLLDLRSQDKGVKTWTGAYMVRAERTPNGKKGKYVCETVLSGLFDNEGKASAMGIALAEQRRRAVHSVLMSAYGVGSFMAGQIVDDWGWTYLLKDALDTYTWAPLGPGSIRGLNRLLGSELLTASIDPVRAISYMSEMRFEVKCQLGETYNDLTLMDIQNCLCEYDKYERVRLGEGRPRSLYKPERAY